MSGDGEAGADGLEVCPDCFDELIEELWGRALYAIAADGTLLVHRDGQGFGPVGVSIRLWACCAACRRARWSTR